MKLHHNKEIFQEIIEATATHFGLLRFQVEKDYFVSLFLKRLFQDNPYLIFKGGTSLSKCYDAIERFSEDIDLVLNFEEEVTPTKKRKLLKKIKKNIITTGENLNFEHLTSNTVQSKKDFNQYQFGFHYVSERPPGTQMLENIIVETIKVYESFPCENIEASNYITKYLENNNEIELIDQYNLKPFIVKTQTIERTFIDKIFAICDYQLEDKAYRNSRHLYDIHMIYKSGKINKEHIQELFPKVANVRRNGRHTQSAAIGFELHDKLNEIIFLDFYNEDYRVNTLEYLHSKDEITYEIAIQTIKRLIEDEWIPKIVMELEEVK